MEEDVTYLKAVSRNLSVRAEENSEKPNSG
jgi:hypothetical protein